MTTIAQLHAQHREMLAAANRLVALISQDPPPSMDVLATVRANLVRMFDQHIACEQPLVESELGGSSDPIARSLARRYSSEMLDLRVAVSAHSGKWNNVVVQSDWAGYAIALHGQLAPVIKHMAWEERVIFPLIEVTRERRRQLRTG